MLITVLKSMSYAQVVPKPPSAKK